MSLSIPSPVPQLPVRDLDRAIQFYQSKFGFSLDWKYQDGIAGVSRDRARLFLDRLSDDVLHPVRVWLNLESVDQVDDLHRQWNQAGVLIDSPPQLKPWGLYEFIAQDCDGNSFRVFFDTETPKKACE
jgi:predicted enzyme related to lactoylglutathione lyase